MLAGRRMVRLPLLFLALFYPLARRLMDCREFGRSHALFSHPVYPNLPVTLLCLAES